MDQMEAVYLKMLYLIAFFLFFVFLKDTEDETVFDKLHHFGICFTRIRSQKKIIINSTKNLIILG